MSVQCLPFNEFVVFGNDPPVFLGSVPVLVFVHGDFVVLLGVRIFFVVEHGKIVFKRFVHWKQNAIVVFVEALLRIRQGVYGW